MSPTLGGSLFVRNAFRYDYCVFSAIRSLAALCDKVVVGDACSEDGTTEALREFVSDYHNVTLVRGLPWECEPNYTRISALANRVIDVLGTDWHFMLQADEVIHEDSFGAIREAIKQTKNSALLVSRLNLFGGFDRIIRLGLEQGRKPCSDRVIRIGRRGIRSVSDGESLSPPPGDCDHRYVEDIVIHHFGYVRKPEELVTKHKHMQSWSHGPNSSYDERLDRSLKNGQFDYGLYFADEDLEPLPVPIPKFAKEWVRDREAHWK